MKKLLLLSVIILTSCSIKDLPKEDCNCTKTTYYYKDISTQYIEHIDTYIVGIEDIDCAEQVFKKPLGNDLYYSIKCSE